MYEADGMSPVQIHGAGLGSNRTCLWALLLSYQGESTQWNEAEPCFAAQQALADGAELRL